MSYKLGAKPCQVCGELTTGLCAGPLCELCFDKQEERVGVAL